MNGKKLISRSEMSKLAGVTPAAITKACGGILKSAVTGKRIDLNHPAAIKYIDDKKNAEISLLPGIDPLYEDGIKALVDANSNRPQTIRNALGIGQGRANKIFFQIQSAGQVPEIKNTPPPLIMRKGKKQPHKIPHIRGTKARNEKRKVDPAFLDENQTVEIPENIESFNDMTLKELIEQFGTDIRFRDWLTAVKDIEMINEKRLKSAEKKGELVSRELVKTGIIEPINSAHMKMLSDGAKTMAIRTVAMCGSGMSVGEVEEFIKDQISSFIKPVKTRIKRAMAKYGNQ